MWYGYFRTKITDAATTVDGYHGYTIEELFHGFFFFLQKGRKVDHGRPVFEADESFNEQENLRSDELPWEVRYLLNLFSGVIWLSVKFRINLVSNKIIMLKLRHRRNAKIETDETSSCK